MDKFGSVILIDDEKHVRQARKQTLELAGYEVACYASAEDALRNISPEWPGIILSDFKMHGMDGMELLKKVVRLDRDLPFILVTGHGDIPLAVQAMQLGAYDFIEKPCSTGRLLDVVRRAMEKRRLVLDNRNLRTRLAGNGAPGVEIIGKSPAIQQLKRIVRNVAESNVDVLVLGETGTGKEIVARALHAASSRARKNFVPVNCGAIPETIIESELFGHEAGAFTGATQRRIGKFEYANGGTLFLDEIESMPLQLQVRLLRVLQERVIERLGSNQSIPVDIRVVAATKVDLKTASDQNLFREDLYYRLNVVKIDLAPLRDRREDIPLLFHYFATRASQNFQLEIPSLPSDLIQNLMIRPWPGNVRELKNEAERFVLGLDQALKETPTEISTRAEVSPPYPQMDLRAQVDIFEKTAIELELKRQKGDIKKTCKALGIPRQTLYDKIHKHGIRRADFTCAPR